MFQSNTTIISGITKNASETSALHEHDAVTASEMCQFIRMRLT